MKELYKALSDRAIEIYGIEEHEIESIAEAYHAQKEAEKWISVDDRLPDPWREGSVVSKEVFIHYKDGDIDRFGSGRFGLIDFKVWHSNAYHTVKHWMSIPPLPISKDGMNLRFITKLEPVVSDSIGGGMVVRPKKVLQQQFSDHTGKLFWIDIPTVTEMDDK